MRPNYAERVDSYATAPRSEAEAGGATCCVFDNTASSAATRDALALVDALGA